MKKLKGGDVEWEIKVKIVDSGINSGNMIFEIEGVGRFDSTLEAEKALEAATGKKYEVEMIISIITNGYYFQDQRYGDDFCDCYSVLEDVVVKEV